MSAIVTFSSVTCSIQDRILFQNVSFELQQGQFCYLVGRTGVGKSSILKLLYADMLADRGEIAVAGFRVTGLNSKDVPMLRRKLGIIFQDYQLLPDRNVYQNLYFALKATGWRKTAHIKQRIDEVLIQVGMTGKAGSMPHQLSGGEQQRVVIARALLNEPMLLIADEPTGNLDPETSVYIMDLLQKIHHAGTAVLMATHEYQLIKAYPARVLELAQGSLSNYSKGEEFLLQYGSRLR